jgi:hypothetical protein
MTKKTPEKLQGMIRKVGVRVDMSEWMARSGGFGRTGVQSLPLFRDTVKGCVYEKPIGKYYISRVAP